MQKLDKDLVRFRLANESDISFIFNSWLKSFRETSKSVSISSVVYYANHHKMIEGLLKKCDVTIACEQQNPAHIFGYICAEKVTGVDVIHFTYVKESYRRLGMARLLCEAAGVDLAKPVFFTHRCKKSGVWMHNKNDCYLIHNPYLAYYGFVEAMNSSTKPPMNNDWDVDNV